MIGAMLWAWGLGLGARARDRALCDRSDVLTLDVARCTLHVLRLAPHTSCFTLHAARFRLHASRLMPRASRLKLQGSRFMPRTTPHALTPPASRTSCNCVIDFTSHSFEASLQGRTLVVAPVRESKTLLCTLFMERICIAIIRN